MTWYILRRLVCLQFLLMTRFGYWQRLHFSFTCLSIILYADDIILLAPLVTALQSLLDTCEDELYILDMFINSSKSKCIRFGSRYKNTCANITTMDCKIIEWVGSCRYLGLFFISGPKLKINNDNVKTKFYRAFNSIMGKLTVMPLTRLQFI